MNSFLHPSGKRLIPIFVLSALATTTPIHAQEKLSENDKKDAMEWVKNVKASYLSESSMRIKRAEAAILAACASETAAMNLYVEAMKSRFLNTSALVARMFDRGRGGMRMMGQGGGRGGNASSSGNAASPSAMFSSWRKENTGGNTKPGLRKALQLQFKWLLLCIKKSQAEKNEQELDIRGNAMGIIDEYIANAKDISESMGLASTSTGIVREYLDITDLRSEKMPDSLSNIQSIFEQVFCQPYKDANDVEGLRKMWQKRIAAEVAILNALNSNNKDAKNNAIEVANLTLKRQMERELECYEMGDEVRSVEQLKKIITTMREPSDKQAAIKSMEDMLSGKKSRTGNSSRRREGGRPRW